VTDETKKILALFEQKNSGGFQPVGGATAGSSADIHREISRTLAVMFRSN
jgi:hypothetical protein